MSEKPKTTAEQMNELNKALREVFDAITAVYVKACKDINAAWERRKI